MTTTTIERAIGYLRELAAQAAASWTGCDWTTSYGRTGLNLDGADPCELREAADRLESTWNDEDMPVAASIDSSDRPYAGCSAKDGYEAVEDDVERWRADYIDDLRSGADWVEGVEADASSAAKEADEIMDGIEAGEISEINYHGSPCSIEDEYGGCTAWRDWQEAAEELCRTL